VIVRELFDESKPIKSRIDNVGDVFEDIMTERNKLLKENPATK